MKMDDKNPLFDPSINYGTWESIIYLLTRKEELASIRKQLFTDESFRLPEPVLKTKILHKSEVIYDNWCVPYMMWPGRERRERFFFSKEGKRPV